LDLLELALSTSDKHEVITASSGLEALQIVQQQARAFDCLLVDIQMPIMDGVSLVSEIRKQPGYLDTPIIMVTAMSEKKYIEDAFAAGATDYITKPFDTFELDARLSLAEKHTLDCKNGKTDSGEIQKLKIEMDGKLETSLHEPIEVQGIERALGFVAFENYLLQLTRGALFLSSVFAIKIADIQTHYNKASPSEFRNILTSAAQTIAECTKEDRNLFSYRGNGLFLCIHHVKIRSKSNEMLQALHKAKFQSISADEKNQSAENYKFIVGEQLSLGYLTRASTLHTLRSAAEKLEMNPPNLRRGDMKPNYARDSRVSERMLAEQRRLEYQEMLTESREMDMFWKPKNRRKSRSKRSKTETLC
jgi:CheY-like chemotaxis protein